MDDPFYSSYRGILRAQDHINDLDRRIKTFGDSKPYAMFVDLHDDGINEAHKIKFIRSLPDIFSDLVVDAVYNLRAALDQAGYAVATLHGGGDPRKTHFPFGDTITEAESRGIGTSKNIPKEVFALMMSFKPYKGGNDKLWALNNLCNISKHRMLQAVGVTFVHNGFEKFEVTTGKGRIIDNPVWNSEKNEIIYAIFEPGSKFEYNLSTRFQVAFGDVEGIAGQPVIPFLNETGEMIRKIIFGIREKCFLIGLLKKRS